MKGAVRLYLLLLIFGCSQQTINLQRTPSAITQTPFIDENLEQIISRISPKVPFSGSILVQQKDSALLHQSLGFANREFAAKNTTETKYLISSMSKQFTAAAIYILATKGKLDLSDPVSHYIPREKVAQENREHWSKVTIRDLLDHRAGLMKDVQVKPTFSLEQQHSLFEITQNLTHDPSLLTHKYGQFHYSNVGYILLARIIELVSHFKYRDFLSHYIFRPLKMTNSGVYHRKKIIKNMAQGYYYDEDGKYTKHCCIDSTISTGSHNLYSTTGDLLLWLKEITSQHKVISSDFIRDLMKSSTFVKKDLLYANGLYLQKGVNTYLWHDGFNSGYASYMSYDLENEKAMIILSNRVDIFTSHNQMKKLRVELHNLATSNNKD